MTEQQFLKAIEQYPELTASGFGGTKGGSVEADRADLPKFYEPFVKSLQYLKAASRKDLEAMFRRDSYALKHTVERAVGTYVPEGAFDLAALVFGCTVKRQIEGSPSVYFELPED